MRWRKQSIWFFGAGIVLLALSLFIFGSLHLMNARAHVSPSPSGSAFPFLIAKEPTHDTEDGFVEVDWEYWKSVNPDIIAWVSVEGTAINYPIMRAPRDDPHYYLHHDIYRTYSVYGVPYVDTDTDSSTTSAQQNGSVFNAIIYGHHMDDGSMFSDFASYSDEAYAQDHAIVCLQTPAGKQRLRVALIKIINGDTTPKEARFPDEEAFWEWYQQQRSDAFVVLDADSSTHNNLRDDDTHNSDGSTSDQDAEFSPSEIAALPEYTVTFCTCSYHEFQNERTLVICRPEDTG